MPVFATPPVVRSRSQRLPIRARGSGPGPRISAIARIAPTWYAALAPPPVRTSPTWLMGSTCGACPGVARSAEGGERRPHVRHGEVEVHLAGGGGGGGGGGLARPGRRARA